MYIARPSRRQALLFNIPNILSSLRIILILPILYCLQREYYTGGITLLSLAFITDFIDGTIARRTKTTSLSGAILDPVADKLLIVALLIFFTAKGILDPAYFLISMTRDVAQLMAIPILLFWKNIKFKVQPALIAKIATGLKFFIIAILLMTLLNEYFIFGVSFKFILYPTLMTSALLECVILVGYLRRFKEIYTGTHDTFE